MLRYLEVSSNYNTVQLGWDNKSQQPNAVKKVPYLTKK